MSWFAQRKYREEKETLLWIVDDYRYARLHCYQPQLGETLRKHFRVRCVSLGELATFGTMLTGPVRNYHHILCSVRIRVLKDKAGQLAPHLSGKRIWIYDEDPWEAFMDGSVLRGAYETIRQDFARQDVDLCGFLVQSAWWTEFIRARGLPARNFQIGLLPRLCTMGRAWDERKTICGFQGSPKAHRMGFFAELGKQGIHVTQLPFVGYHRYLDQLQNIQIFIHPEITPFMVDGKPVVRNVMWGRDIEVAAQGAFVLRNEEPEGLVYGIDHIPTIRTFRTVGDVLSLVDEITKMDPVERDKCRQQAVDYIKERDYWRSVVDVIHIPDFYRD
jgi:hypothetical protein